MKQLNDGQDFLETSRLNPLLCNLSDYGLVKVGGKEASKLLQGQLTCDVLKIAPNMGTLGAQCNPQGRIISLFYLFLFEDAYYLLMPKSMVPISLNTLKKYALFYKVELIDASDTLLRIGYKGPLPQGPGVTLSIAKDRYILLHPGTEMPTHWLKLAEEATKITLNAWKCLNIADRLPMIYPETSGKLLPHELNLQETSALSFEKGCYTGQEIIARMHYRAKLKNHLYPVQIPGQTPPLPGSPLYAGLDNRISGLIVEACHSGYNSNDALIVTEALNAKNEHLFSDPNNKTFLTFKTMEQENE